jgi:hypothetical protein
VLVRTAALESRPWLLRELIQARCLLKHEQRGLWRRLSLELRWRRGLLAGQPWSLAPEQLSVLQPPAMATQLLAAKV